MAREPVDAVRKRGRRNESLVAKYLQRYCAKNETIGFSGPNGWGAVREDGPAITLWTGPSLVALRAAQFEYWAIDAAAGP